MQAALVQSWQPSESAVAGRWYIRLLPCLTDFAFILPIFVLFGMLAGTHQLFSDGDTGWHIRTGEWILAHGQVPHLDLFSFTKPGEPWYAWEWGWDVLFAAVNRWTGLAGVAFLNVLLLGLVSVLVFRLIRRYSNNDLLTFAFTMLAVCGSIIHWLARPHLVSWVLALVFSHLILSREEGDRKALFYLPGLMVLWTNLHGAFFVGILLLGISAVGEALQVTFAAEKPALSNYKKAVEYLACAAACTIATLVNPYGWHLHQHLISFLGDAAALDNISEYQSISFHHPGAIFFESMLVMGAAAALWCFANRRVALGLTVLVWAHAALFSGRNIPFFTLLAAAPVVLMTQDVLNRLGRSPLLTQFAAALKETASEMQPLERAPRVYMLSGLAVFFVGLNLAAGTPGYRPEFNPEDFPTHAFERMHAAGITHLFADGQWSDYLIYRYYPSQTVFMDGRIDFYGMSVVKSYQHMMSAQYDCESLLRKFSIDGVLVKPDAPIATLLKHSSDWKILFDDGSAVLFERRGSRTQ